MITWLSKDLDLKARIIVTAVIGAWMITMLVVMVLYNQRIIREMQAEFQVLQDQHKESKAFLDKNINKFATTIERNTEQTKKNAEIIKDVASPDK